MKMEISIEEKARRYDEAYKKVAVRFGSNVADEIFLKESEDERIRKALLEMVHDTTGDELWVDYNVHKEEALAWLEKQGEQNTAWSEEDESRIITICTYLQDYARLSGSELRTTRINEYCDWLKSLRPKNTWKPSDLPHWKKSTLPNDNTTGFNSDYFCYKGYNINYKELFEKLPKDD